MDFFGKAGCDINLSIYYGSVQSFADALVRRWQYRRKGQIFVMPVEGGGAQRNTSVNSKRSGTSQIRKVRSNGGEMIQATQGGGSNSSETLDGKWL